jgi:phenylalanyl-tRNA synthetase alpha chain
MNDLARYRPVSDLPAITRDVSVAISADDDAEQLGDPIRSALGERAAIVEAVTILSETRYADLSQGARERLGMDQTQKNVLVRLDLRPVDRTLTGAEANGLRDEIYDVIHRGSTGQWAER